MTSKRSFVPHSLNGIQGKGGRDVDLCQTTGHSFTCWYQQFQEHVGDAVGHGDSDYGGNGDW